MSSNRTGAAAHLAELVRLIAGAFRQHDLLTYASAIAFRSVFTSSAIFIVGAELDELLRKDTETGESVGVLQLLRAAFGR